MSDFISFPRSSDAENALNTTPDRKSNILEYYGLHSLQVGYSVGIPITKLKISTMRSMVWRAQKKYNILLKLFVWEDKGYYEITRLEGKFKKEIVNPSVGAISGGTAVGQLNNTDQPILHPWAKGEVK